MSGRWPGPYTLLSRTTVSSGYPVPDALAGQLRHPVRRERCGRRGLFELTALAVDGDRRDVDHARPLGELSTPLAAAPSRSRSCASSRAACSSSAGRPPAPLRGRRGRRPSGRARAAARAGRVHDSHSRRSSGRSIPVTRWPSSRSRRMSAVPTKPCAPVISAIRLACVPTTGRIRGFSDRGCVTAVTASVSERSAARRLRCNREGVRTLACARS